SLLHVLLDENYGLEFLNIQLITIRSYYDWYLMCSSYMDYLRSSVDLLITDTWEWYDPDKMMAKMNVTMDSKYGHTLYNRTTILDYFGNFVESNDLRSELRAKTTKYPSNRAFVNSMYREMLPMEYIWNQTGLHSRSASATTTTTTTTPNSLFDFWSQKETKDKSKAQRKEEMEKKKAIAKEIIRKRKIKSAHAMNTFSKMYSSQFLSAIPGRKTHSEYLGYAIDPELNDDLLHAMARKNMRQGIIYTHTPNYFSEALVTEYLARICRWALQHNVTLYSVLNATDLSK
ncbi:hypothetical protein RFI_20084, partial [Reticulomyxa filosa]